MDLIKRSTRKYNIKHNIYFYPSTTQIKYNNKTFKLCRSLEDKTHSIATFQCNLRTSDASSYQYLPRFRFNHNSHKINCLLIKDVGIEPRYSQIYIFLSLHIKMVIFIIIILQRIMYGLKISY